MLQRSVIALLNFLKAFALDVREIDVDRFRQTLDALAEQFKSQETPSRLEAHFENSKEILLEYAERQHLYIAEREKQLRHIIDLLSRALANLNVENRDFYQWVYDRGKKIVDIGHLDDPLNIKEALKAEAEKMCATVDQNRDRQQRQMQQLADQVDILRQELERNRTKSMIDGLTGIYNRQAFDEYLAEKIENNEARKHNFALLMLELDDFRNVNDKLGHLIGDRLLVVCAQKCRSSIRSDDFLARYGDQAFAILLWDANLRNALKKARQICANIASAHSTTNEKEPDASPAMTVSIGVSAYKKGDTPHALITRADAALRDAKRSGKNRAVSRKT